MVVKEFYRTRDDGVRLYKSYSNEGYYIQKVGTDEVYTEAIDVETASYVYVETNEKIEEMEVIDDEYSREIADNRG